MVRFQLVWYVFFRSLYASMVHQHWTAKIERVIVTVLTYHPILVTNYYILVD